MKLLIIPIVLMILILPCSHSAVVINAKTKEPSAKELLALLNDCNKAGGDYYMETDKPAAIPICKLNGAFYWKADMSIDCDGIRTDKCNSQTDVMYQDDTTLHTSIGLPLNATTLPYIVIPLPSERWDFKANNIEPGAVVVVIYKDKVRYGIFGDVGPANIIGEASYAMAKSFGANTNPTTGGIKGIKVTYIVFPGSRVYPAESHEAAVVLGERLAAQLLQDNR